MVDSCKAFEEQKRPVLTISHLLVERDGKPFVRVPNLTVYEGECLVLIGPNGSGKTTLLQAIARLIPLKEGSIIFQGNVVTRKNELHYRRRLAMVFQEPLLLDTTVFENVAVGLRFRGMNGRKLEREIRYWLEMFSLHDFQGKRVKDLSSGEAQRVSLARAFAVNPDVLLLDEPFASLDCTRREELMSTLKMILKKTGITVIMATHDRYEALCMAHRLAVLRDGNLVQVDLRDAVLRKPANAYVATFLGIETLLPGEVISANSGVAMVRVGEHILHTVGNVSPGDCVLCCIRPDSVVICRNIEHGQMSMRNFFQGRIAEISYNGVCYRLLVDCGFPLVSYVTATSLEEMNLQAGEEVWASFKATSVHIIKT